MAIQEAIAHLDTPEHHDIDIFIFSDSQAALRALTSYTTNSKQSPNAANLLTRRPLI